MPAAAHSRIQLPPVSWCVAVGTKVDSAFAVTQARSLFASSDFPLKPQSAERVVARVMSQDSSVSVDLPEGWLVRLIPENPNTLGGGGLIWVDGETACPVLLRHYE